MAGRSDLESRSILTAVLVTLLGTAAVLLLTGPSLSASQPQIIEGDFALDRGPLLSTADSCSTDTDCSQTTCHDGTYYVDTDGDRDCTTDPDGNQVCAGYDTSYVDAEICGGRYDYNCDSTGCDGYKAACEDDCGANTGCDTYDFCSDDSDSGDSTDSTSDGSTTSCTDQCQSLTKKCDGAGQIVQCQDTDSDACTDGFVTIATCDGDCENAQCVAPESTATAPNETTPAPDQTEPVEPDPAPAPVTDRVVQALQTVWTTLTGWL